MYKPPRLTAEFPVERGDFLFSSDEVSVTAEAYKACSGNFDEIHKLIKKHFCGDWFFIDDATRMANAKAVVMGGPITTHHKFTEFLREVDVVIHTDSARNTTTFFLSSELKICS